MAFKMAEGKGKKCTVESVKNIVPAIPASQKSVVFDREENIVVVDRVGGTGYIRQIHYSMQFFF